MGRRHSATGTLFWGKLDMFYAQQTAMQSIGVHFLPNGRLNCRFDWDIVEYPGLLHSNVRYSATFGSYESWMINKDTKSPEAAKDFVRWLFQPDVMRQISSLGVVIPSQPQQARSFLNQPAPPHQLNAFVKSMDFAKRLPQDHPAGPYVNSNFTSGSNPIYANMVAGRVPVATALPEIARQINAYLTEWWAQR